MIKCMDQTTGTMRYIEYIESSDISSDALGYPINSYKYVLFGCKDLYKITQYSKMLTFFLNAIEYYHSIS